MGTVFLGLALLLAVLLPLGWILLRFLEYVRGRRFAISSLERALVAPYLSVALLVVLASLSIPIYNVWLVASLIMVGALSAAVLWRKEPWSRLRLAPSGRGLRILCLVGGGTAALLYLEVVSAGTHPFPNAYDGSFQSLYAKLILTQHTIPWTLAPYGQIGVVYPQGAAIWLTLPVLLFGWPIESSPVAVPLLFLSLAVPAAFGLGDRLGGHSTPRGEMTGLLFAGFFGLVASWPRLFVGGSYDFAIGLPLFLIAVGWVRPFTRVPKREWRDVFLFGGLLGILTLFSVALGEALFLLLFANLIAFRVRSRAQIREWITRLGVIVATGVAFVGRSVAGLIIWFGQPGHVLNAVGSSPYATQPGLPSPSLDTFVGNLDPFVPLKWKLSPFPVLSVELQVLLATGLTLCVVVYLVRRSSLGGLLGHELVGPILVGTATMFLWTFILVSSSGTWVGTSILDVVASLYESSFLLFIFFQLVALVPLVALAEHLRAGRPRAPSIARQPIAEGPPAPRAQSPAAGGHRRIPAAAIAVALLLAVPLVSGTVVTVVQVPDFLSGHLAALSNVTPADVTALQWAGAHLPSCSRVLVGPGSAGQFLPLYANAQLVFPMTPLPLNLSYYVAVGDLTAGVYSNSTRAALVSLPITEVFVTGQTSVSYPPLSAAPMASSADFSALFASGDATIFEFIPGAMILNCPP